MTQTDTVARGKFLFEFLAVFFFEIFLINKDFPGKWHLTRPQIQLGVILCTQHFHMPFRQIFNYHFQRTQHSHRARRVFIQIITQSVFQHGDIDHTVAARYSNHVAEIAHGTRGKTAATHTRNGRHTRIVPAGHHFFIHQKLQLTLGSHGVIEIQPTKLVLTRTRRYRKILNEPIIQRFMIFKFQRAYGMRNAFNRIRLTMSKIVSGVNTPLITGLMVMRFTDTIQNRVAQVHIRRCHINSGAQHAGAFVKFAGAHTGKQIEVFSHAALTERAIFTRLSQSATVFARLIRTQIAHIGFALFNQVYRPGMQLVEVIGGIAHLSGPLKTQPANIIFDGVDVFLILFFRVGVIETQIADTAELLRNTKVQANGLSMTNMQITIWLRREAGNHRRYATSIQVILNDLGNKVVIAGNCVCHNRPFLVERPCGEQPEAGNRAAALVSGEKAGIIRAHSDSGYAHTEVYYDPAENQLW